MKGEMLITKYVIDSVEYKQSDLSKTQKEYIDSIMDKKKYDEFRNKLLNEEGDSLEGVIKIHFPEQRMEGFDEFGVLLNDYMRPYSITVTDKNQ
jgi:folate-dependent tRNA-U54 methylase TrmFO/GidA